MGRFSRFAAFGGAASLVLLVTACQPPSPWDAERVNVDSAGNQANGYTDPKPVASPDGTKVAFSSRATNLVADSEGDGVFVRDLTTGTTTRAGNRPAYGLTFSPDGTKLLQFAYATDTSGAVDMVLADLTAGTSTTLVTNVNNAIYTQHPNFPGDSQASFSPDGSKIVFDGWAQAAGNPPEGASCILPLPHNPPLNYNCFDVYVYDLGSGVITLVSHTTTGTGSNGTSARPSFSPDGTKVLYVSQSGGQVPTGTPAGQVYIRDLATDALTTVDVVGGTTPNGSASGARFSPDGTRVVFTSTASNLGPTDTNNAADVYLRNLAGGTPLTLVSANATGTNSGNNLSSTPVFSPDGSRIAFVSYASDLGPTDTHGTLDVYLGSVTGGSPTELVSTNGDCTDSDDKDSFLPVFSPDGERILFTTSAGNLGPKDTNQNTDVYVHELDTCTNTLASARADGTDAGNNATSPFAAFVGASRVLFLGYATDLVPGDTNDQPDVFLATLRGADLAITGNGFWREGAETYNLRVSNDGPQAATGVKVSATLPAGANSIGGPGSCTVQGNTVACTVGGLGVGETRDVPISFALQDPQPGFEVTAAVSATTVDPDGADNAVTFTVTTSG